MITMVQMGFQNILLTFVMTQKVIGKKILVVTIKKDQETNFCVEIREKHLLMVASHVLVLTFVGKFRLLKFFFLQVNGIYNLQVKKSEHNNRGPSNRLRYKGPFK